MKMMRRLRWIAAAPILFASGACASPVEDEEAQAGALEAQDDARATPISCDGSFESRAMNDEFLAETKTLRVTLAGRTALAVGSTAGPGESFTVTAIGRDGKRDGKKTAFYYSPTLANAGTSTRTYTVTITPAKDRALFWASCYPLVGSEKPSAITDHAMCELGKACTQSTPSGPKRGTCSANIHPNIGEGPGAGHCG